MSVASPFPRFAQIALSIIVPQGATEVNSENRASNLYPCLISVQASEYYHLHRCMAFFNDYFLGTDNLLYSPQVTFFKEEDSKGVPQNTSQWFHADVITCAAPFFKSGSIMIPDNELIELFIKRIQNILEAAIDCHVEALVLGAFGCGAFHNPPMLVAEAFRQTLLMPRYRQAFAEICFAIKRSGDFCRNIEAFEMKIASFPEELHFSPERNKRSFFE